MSKKKIAILGSTGSIGKTTIEIIKKDKKSFDVILLTANNNFKEINKQIKYLKPKNLVINNKKIYLKNTRVKRGIGQTLQAISESFQKIKFNWVRSILLSPGHGERGNELSETLYFRAQWWRAMFAENGWKVEEERPSGLFYSGNALFGHALPLQARRRLAQLLGSSTRLFKVVKLQR